VMAVKEVFQTRQPRDEVPA
jgi:hypothetical protein